MQEDGSLIILQKAGLVPAFFILKITRMEQNKNMHNMQSMSYKKFVVMMVISFIIMYIVMFLNVIEIKHYHTSITRIYMAILMVAPMAVVMMLMMGKMYPDKKINMGIIVERANIQDPEVKNLAEDIIKAQRKEIAEMEAIIDRMGK